MGWAGGLPAGGEAWSSCRYETIVSYQCQVMLSPDERRLRALDLPVEDELDPGLRCDVGVGMKGGEQRESDRGQKPRGQRALSPRPTGLAARRTVRAPTRKRGPV